MTTLQQGSRLKGKVVLITGGGSGFGRAIALRFAQEGASLLIGDMNHDTAQETAKQCKGTDNVDALSMNVTIEKDWQAAVQKAVDTFGRLDIIINNAGTSYKNKPTLEVTEDEFDRCFNVNVKSIFWSVKVGVPAMKKSGDGGSILSIASIGAMRPRPGLVWYNATKAAVTNSTKALAAEYGPDNIRVNSLCPLLSGTGLFEAFVGVPFTEENVKKFVGAVPLGRLTDPLDVANAALFFTSDEAKFLTGVNMEIDGGKGI